MDLKSKVEQAKARRDATKAKLTPQDIEEIALRSELETIESEEKAERKRQQDLDIARRMERARAKLGEKAAIISLTFSEYEDTFIVIRDNVAHRMWRKALEDKGMTGKGDSEEIRISYAVASVYDWNGEETGTPEITLNLKKYLTENLGLVTPITDAAVELAGALAAERKS
jgi:hypothetical protein